ncbi:hypothetical protein C476_17062 [Natrinema limicola JCM 13563]|uniref:Uncharacterized protein n=1 Tax=Natrinema limicola JCM 13563 TaxID=1230457 RepID=M0C005_9EURY|nr:hypothetical protein C476_17062 [Natrinema limicola JCM 13563]
MTNQRNRKKKSVLLASQKNKKILSVILVILISLTRMVGKKMQSVILDRLTRSIRKKTRRSLQVIPVSLTDQTYHE